MTVNCSRIDSDFVFLNQGFLKDGVTKNDGFAEIMGALDEGISCPEAPVTGLPAAMHPRLQTGMYVKSVFVFP